MIKTLIFILFSCCLFSCEYEVIDHQIGYEVIDHKICEGFDLVGADFQLIKNINTREYFIVVVPLRFEHIWTIEEMAKWGFLGVEMQKFLWPTDYIELMFGDSVLYKKSLNDDITPENTS